MAYRVERGEEEVPQKGLLRAPHLRDLGEESRSATPLELFFDLVFTAVLGQVAARFGRDPSVEGVVECATLSLPVVWTWTQYTFYANRFDSDDALYRVAKAVGMAGVALMGIGVSGAFGERSALFVAGFVVARLLLLLLYGRSYRHLEEEGPRSTIGQYLAAFAGGAVLWLATLLLGAPQRPYAWAAIVVLECLVPPFAWQRLEGPKVNVSHLAERHGLFTILVLAGGWLAIVGGVATVGVVTDVVVVSAALFVGATAVWWLYFDHTEARSLQEGRKGLVYVYGHLVLFVGLVISGAAAEVVVLAAQDASVAAGARWGLAGGIAAFLACLGVFRLTGAPASTPAARVRLAAILGLLVLPILGEALPPPWFVTLAVAPLPVLLLAEMAGRPPDTSQHQASD